VGAQLGGAPQRVHLGEEATAVVGERVRAEARVVPLGHEDGEPADGGGDGPAPGLGGVGGEDGVELEGPQAARGLPGPHLGCELRVRRREG